MAIFLIWLGMVIFTYGVFYASVSNKNSWWYMDTNDPVVHKTGIAMCFVLSLISPISTIFAIIMNPMLHFGLRWIPVETKKMLTEKIRSAINRS